MWASFGKKVLLMVVDTIYAKSKPFHALCCIFHFITTIIIKSLNFASAFLVPLQELNDHSYYNLEKKPSRRMRKNLFSWWCFFFFCFNFLHWKQKCIKYEYKVHTPRIIFDVTWVHANNTICCTFFLQLSSLLQYTKLSS